MRVTVVLLALFSAVASGAPVVSDEGPELQRIPLTPQLKLALIKDLENDMLRVAALKAAAQTVQLEEAAEETLLEAADEALKEEPSPERTQHIKEVETLLKRDRRAVQLLQGLLGGSSGGGGGGEASASAGSDSGSILNLVTPLLGSSSGGSGGGGGAGGAEGEGSEGAGGASAGSDSGSILSLVGPLLGSSSGGSGGSGGAEGSASGGSDSGSILNLVVPLLGSSSGSSGGSGGGGGGSDLSSILSLSSSSKQGGGTGEIVVMGDGNGNSLKSSLKGGKFALVQDKLQLVLRAKFGAINKILGTITNKIAQTSLTPDDAASINHLKYPS